MTEKHIYFSVIGERITLAEPIEDEIIADSDGYLRAHFSVDSFWDGAILTAIFFAEDTDFSRAVPLGEDMNCIVPGEVLHGSYFFVGIGGIDGAIRVYTDAVKITQDFSCFYACEYPEPQPNVYDALIKLIGEKIDKNQGEENAGKALVVGEDGNVVPKYIEGGGGSCGYNIGSGLKLDISTNTLSVDTADEVEADNTKPITSAAVHETVGNIEAILRII